MAPSEEERFAAAEKLWISGDARAAVQVHVELSYCAQNPDIRLRSAIALIERLNPAWDVDIILDACSTGIEMAEKLGERETRAHLMPMRAKNLAVFNGSLVTTRKNLKLTPNWLGFSLERDELQYQELTARIAANDDEIGHLAREAQAESGDRATLGDVLLSVGDISLQRYMSIKTECLRHAISLPRFIRERLRTCVLDEYFWYSTSDRRAMRRELEDCERQYCNAVTAFRTQGDDLNVARAYYNLSNALRTANRYRRAKRYLKQAEIIARRLNDETLLKKIPLLKERIRQRNRNVPNYAAGEGRADE